MNNQIAVWAILSLVGFLTACQPGDSNEFSAQDEAAIRNAVEEVVTLLNAEERDCTAYVQHYFAMDAIFIAPYAPEGSGHDDLIAFCGEYPAYEDLSLQIDELVGRGDLAYVRGTYSWTLTGGATPVEERGNYLEIWKRQDNGAWKVSRNIFNSNIPSTTEGESTFTAEDAAAIRALVEKHVVDFNARDWPAFIGYYTDDAVRMPPNASIIRGHAAITASAEESTEATPSVLTLTPQEVAGDGDLAYARGTLALESASPEAAPANMVGKWQAVYERQSDGSWLCTSDIWNWNTDAPAD